MQPDMVGRGHTQATANGLGQITDIPLHILGQVQHSICLAHQQFPSRRQSHTFTQSVEQCHAQSAFERLYALAHRWLADVQLLSSGRKGTQAGDMYEGIEFVQVHGERPLI